MPLTPNTIDSVSSTHTISAALGEDPGQLLKGQPDLLGRLCGIVTGRRILTQHA